MIVWFLSYTVSLKMISYQTGVMEGNLKFSPVIMAIPLSLVLTFSIVMVFSILMLFMVQLLSNFSIFMTARLREKIVKSQFYLFSTRSFYIIPLMLPILILTGLLSQPIFRMALIADSSFISDCGEKLKNKMYLRMDSHSCIVSTLDVNVFSSSPDIIKSEKP